MEVATTESLKLQRVSSNTLKVDGSLIPIRDRATHSHEATCHHAAVIDELSVHVDAELRKMTPPPTSSCPGRFYHFSHYGVKKENESRQTASIDQKKRATLTESCLWMWPGTAVAVPSSSAGMQRPAFTRALESHSSTSASEGTREHAFPLVGNSSAAVGGVNKGSGHEPNQMVGWSEETRILVRCRRVGVGERRRMPCLRKLSHNQYCTLKTILRVCRYLRGGNGPSHIRQHEDHSLAANTTQLRPATWYQANPRLYKVTGHAEKKGE